MFASLSDVGDQIIQVILSSNKIIKNIWRFSCHGQKENKTQNPGASVPVGRCVMMTSPRTPHIHALYLECCDDVMSREDGAQ